MGWRHPPEPALLPWPDAAFAARVRDVPLVRPELVGWPALSWATAAVGWALASRMFADVAMYVACLVLAAVHAAVAIAVRLRAPSAGSPPSGGPRCTVEAAGRTLRGLRAAVAAAQTLGGVFLATVVPAVVARSGGGASPWLVAWALVVLEAGVLLAGRGLRCLLAGRTVERLVLVPPHVQLQADDGTTATLDLRQAAHDPVVVRRADGRATLALAAVRIPSLGRLPIVAVVATAPLPLEEARRWARRYATLRHVPGGVEPAGGDPSDA